MTTTKNDRPILPHVHVPQRISARRTRTKNYFANRDLQDYQSTAELTGRSEVSFRGLDLEQLKQSAHRKATKVGIYHLSGVPCQMQNPALVTHLELSLPTMKSASLSDKVAVETVEVVSHEKVVALDLVDHILANYKTDLQGC